MMEAKRDNMLEQIRKRMPEYTVWVPFHESTEPDTYMIHGLVYAERTIDEKMLAYLVHNFKTIRIGAATEGQTEIFLG